MERTNKKEVDSTTKIKWRKLPKTGSFRMGSGRIIKPGQIFSASLDEISEGFRDVIIPIDAETFTKVNEAQKGTDAVELDYFVQHVASGWYNVVDSDDKIQNEKRLRKDDAEKLLTKLKA